MDIPYYTGSGCLLPVEEYKRQVTAATLGSLYQMIGYTAFEDFLKGSVNQGQLSKEDLVNLLVELNEMLIEAKEPGDIVVEAPLQRTWGNSDEDIVNIYENKLNRDYQTPYKYWKRETR